MYNNSSAFRIYLCTCGIAHGSSLSTLWTSCGYSLCCGHGSPQCTCPAMRDFFMCSNHTARGPLSPQYVFSAAHGSTSRFYPTACGYPSQHSLPTHVSLSHAPPIPYVAFLPSTVSQPHMVYPYAATMLHVATFCVVYLLHVAPIFCAVFQLHLALPRAITLLQVAFFHAAS